MRTLSLLIIAFLTSILSGCGGGKMMITANNLKYPVSASNSIFNDKMETLNYIEIFPTKSIFYEDMVDIKNENSKLESDMKTCRFSFSVTKWKIGWTLFSISDDPDISEQLNNIIEKHNGVGIINLRLLTNQNFLNSLGSFIPVIPTPISATIFGLVVRIKNK
ncbi:MAG: hypothetical protein HW421_2471 [Ignavibacteria bacterium]|nr:hypothetical protein [Ignavibacteria bacterium]